MTTTETRTWKKMIIGVDRRQEEARLSEIRPGPVAPPSEREDDWFILFDMIKEKPVVIPPGTFHYQKVSIHCGKRLREFMWWLISKPAYAPDVFFFIF